MNEFDNYKYLFLKNLYETLNLKVIEQKLLSEKVKPLNIVSDDYYDIISHYFFLLNDVNIEKLNSEQVNKFYTLFSKKISDLSEQELKEALKFIDDTYYLMLFPNTEEKYVYYGPMTDNYICPRDAIALGLYYDAFGDYDDFELENKLADIVNYIQFDLSKKVNKRLAVILFNQLTLENRFSDFSK